MKRKGLIRFLSIVAALMLPLTALAQGAAMDLFMQAQKDGKEIVTTINFEPGAVLSAQQAVSDLSAATELRFTKLPGGYGAFTLVLSGVDTLTAQLRAQADGLFVLSDVLGAKPVYFTWADLNNTITQAMRDSGASDANISQFSQGFMTGFGQGFSTGMAGTGDMMVPLTEAEIKQKITEAMGGDEKFVAWLEGIEASKVVTSGEFTVEGSDAADTKTELVITKEQIAGLLDVPSVQVKIAEQLKAEDATLTDEQLAAKVAEVVATSKEDVLKTDVVIPMTFYTKGAEELVAADFGMTGNFKSSSTTVDTEAVPAVETVTETVSKIAVTAQYVKKTAGDVKTHTMTATASQDDEKRMAMSATLIVDPQTINGALTLLDGKDSPKLIANLTGNYADLKNLKGQMDLTVNDLSSATAVVMDFEQLVSDASVETKLALSSGASVAAIKETPDAARLGTVKITSTVQADSGAFNALKEATPETSLEVLKLSQEDLASFMNTLQSNGLQVVYKIMGNLPPSVTQMLTTPTSGT